MEADVNFVMDGDMWRATRHDFVDLQESPAGFGETQELALLDLEHEEQKHG